MKGMFLLWISCMAKKNVDVFAAATFMCVENFN